MAELNTEGFETISGIKPGNGPGTVDELLRLDNLPERIRQFQDWLKSELIKDDDQLMNDLFGFGQKTNLVKLPDVLTAESFPLKLIRKVMTNHNIGIEVGSHAIFLDHLVPRGQGGETVPYLVIRPVSLSFERERLEPSARRGPLEIWKEKGLNGLLELGLPLDVAQWQVVDHPRMSQRVEHLLGMGPVVYINGKLTGEPALKEELLRLPGAVMKVGGTARFYVADSNY